MSGHDVNETRGVIVEATDAVVAALSARLDALVASWQLAIDAKRKAPVDGNAVPRPPADVLSELERELNDLDRRCLEQEQAAQSETREAESWEQRAMMAARDGHDDLARSAITQVQNHRDAAIELAAEAAEFEGVRESYRNAIAAIRSTTPASATV